MSPREGARLRTGAEKVSSNTHPPMQGTSWQRCGGSIQETSTPEPLTPGRLLGSYEHDIELGMDDQA